MTAPAPPSRAAPAYPPAIPASGLRAPRLTMGVEEEFLLVDRVSRTPVGRGPRVIAAVAPLLGARVEREFYTAQVEVHTNPTDSAATLRAELAWMRREVALAAAAHGCLLLAVGTPVIPPERPLAVTPGDRYRDMAVRFASVLGARDQLVNGCHIHIGVASRAQALALANGMRPWLPVLQAIGANSPFNRGRDSGYASWRSVHHARWPTVGPAPLLDEPAYERLADSLIRSGPLLDRKMIYWYARPSEHVPTLEVRVPDANADLDTVTLLAVLVRGLAATLRTEIADTGPEPFPESARIYGAHRLAALNGLTGDGLDPFSGESLPAWRLVARLRDRAAPGLDASGDLTLVDDLLDHLRATGGGAARQRAARTRRGRLGDVVDSLAATTAAA